VQTIRGRLGGAGLLVVRHAEVGDAPESWMAAQRSWMAAWCFPSLTAHPRSDRARFVGGFRGGGGELWLPCPWPPTLYFIMALRDGGPTTIDWLSAPD